MSVSISHPTGRPNFSIVTIGGVRYAFSYETCVAVADGWKWAVIRNYWGPTTGKHLNYLDNGDKATRLDANAFQIVLQSAGTGVKGK